MKKLLGIMVIGLCGITRDILGTREINQDLNWYEWRKVAPTLENHTGSWWLFTVSAEHPIWHYLTLSCNSYPDNLKFIKNKSHKDSLKTLLKLANKLATKEINQMANIDAFW